MVFVYLRSLERVVLLTLKLLLLLLADTLHYDLPCRSRPTNCIGQDFATTVEGDTWDRPMYEHGTHGMEEHERLYTDCRYTITAII
jgi:hypothetical protein